MYVDDKLIRHKYMNHDSKRVRCSTARTLGSWVWILLRGGYMSMPRMCYEEAMEGADSLYSGTHQMLTLWDLQGCW